MRYPSPYQSPFQRMETIPGLFMRCSDCTRHLVHDKPIMTCRSDRDEILLLLAHERGDKSSSLVIYGSHMISPPQANFKMARRLVPHCFWHVCMCTNANRCR